MHCDYCKNIDYDELVGNPGYRHHPNWQALVSSAIRGCKICELAHTHAREKQGYERDWDTLQQTEQVYLSLSGNNIYWKYADIQRLSIQVYVNHDDCFRDLITARPVGRSVLSNRCTNVMQNWLEDCKSTHSKCRDQDRQHEMPTRLLDVGDSTHQPFLMESKGRWGSWAALSHCWGRSLRLKTTVANRGAHRDGIGLNLNELPPTFRDAVCLARNLGIQHIWIDALCIIQDDHNDWEREAKRMDYIYTNAIVTFAAEASPESSTGIVGGMSDYRTAQDEDLSTHCHSISRGVEGRLYFRIDCRRYRGWSSRGVLSTRGWTLQEELLSTRILRFTDQQVVWRCLQGSFLEWDRTRKDHGSWDFTDKLYDHPKQDSDYGMIPSNREKQQLLKYWYMDVVNFYIGRSLTYHTDRLIAVQGIANEVQAHIGEADYKAGIWYEEGLNHSSDIHKGLAWSSPVGGIRANQQPYVAPSWSWAQIDVSDSTTAGVHNFFYDAKLLESLIPLTNTIKITSATIGRSATSIPVSSVESELLLLEVKAQYLEVCSHIIRSTFFDQRGPDPDRDYYYKFDRISETHNSMFASLGFQALEEACELMGRKPGHKKYFYLQLARWVPEEYDDRRIPVIVALILEEIGTKLVPLYRRVGRALITVDEKWNAKPWPTQHFRVI